ncbi:putative Mg2+ transporter-C (MgtC) family protein [Lentibacillus persicus]|uniref:Putative Mg2+ transporter-C (MgtC) family protein n=1 Tax=Lentibacillus persicus TaxID=640948 RepID=A0A1I2AF89_9BACI|nr:MgtC/SapB family protein [Lentibacillus persicus]SFE42377.1 putative Mg2+ transporter-C (MgtC) family protein [Lentibacillus persicus]
MEYIEYLDELVGENFTIIMIRLLIALLLSGLIGFERELKNHSAGFRTHILVGVGACLMMLLSLYGFEAFIQSYDNIRFDPARIPSYVISGIGFLGAGTIIVNGMTIRGLTTAASIWTVAGLGLVVGAGMYAAAVFTTVIILLSLVFLNNFEKRFRKGHSNKIELTVWPGLEVNRVISTLESYSLTIKKVEIDRIDDDLRNIAVTIDPDKNLNRTVLFENLSQIEHVKSISSRK